MKILQYGMLAGILILGAVCVTSGTRVLAFGPAATVHYKDRGMTGEQLDELCEQQRQEKEEKASLPGQQGAGQEGKELPDITGWYRQEEQNAENPALNIETQTDRIGVWGNMRDVLPGELLAGSYVNSLDEEGCVISSALSEKLFRSTDTTGCTLRVDGKEYVVRGIIAGSGQILLNRAKKTDLLCNLEFRYQGKEYSTSAVRDFLTRQGLTNYDSLLEGGLYAGIAGIFLGLPVLVLAALVIRRGWKRFRHYQVRILPRNQTVSFLCQLAGILSIGCLLALWFWIFVRFPADYVPAGVSDFEFWIVKFHELSVDRQKLLNYQGWYQEAYLLGSLKQCMFGSLGSSLLLYLTARR